MAARVLSRSSGRIILARCSRITLRGGAHRGFGSSARNLGVFISFATCLLPQALDQQLFLREISALLDLGIWPHGTYTKCLDWIRVLAPIKSRGPYYTLAKQFHPDLNKGDSEADKKFQELQHAYEILKDKKKREMYDKMGMGAFNECANNCADFSSAIHELMRAMRMQSSRGVKITLSLSFREAAHGCQNPVIFLALVHCRMCNGSGIRAGARQQPCSECRGLGKNARKQGLFIIRVPCSACGGSGSQNFCNVCSGGGVVRETKTHDMRIPAGLDTGMRIIICKVDPLGRLIDLILILKVLDDPVFWREREDVHMNLAIDLTTAILGE